MMMPKKLLLVIIVVVMCFPCSVIAQSKKVVIAATDWAPYSGSDLLNGGFLSEIAITAFAKVGYTPELKILPWKRALSEAQEGVYEALIGASYTEERAAFFIYPKYAWDNYTFFFSKKGRKWQYKTPEDLCPAKIGLFMGSFYVKRFSAIPCLKSEEIPTIRQSIRMLLSGRLDLFLDSKDAVDYYLQKEFSDQKNDIEPVLPHFELDKLYIVISKKIPQSEQIAADFDRGIEMIKSDGSYAEILEKHGITPIHIGK